MNHPAINYQVCKSAISLFSKYASNCSQSYWEKSRRRSVNGFVKVLSEGIGIKIAISDEVAHLHMDVRPDANGLIVSPFSKMLSRRSNRRVMKSLDSKDRARLKERLVNLVSEVEASGTVQVEEPLNRILKDIWTGEELQVFKYATKANHNILHTVISILLASAGKLLGLDEKLFPSDKYSVQGESFIAYRHVAIAQDCARLSVLPCSKKVQSELFDALTLADSPVMAIVEYCKVEGIITSIFLKKIADFIRDSRARANYHVITVQAHEDNTFKAVTEVYSVDCNGFGKGDNLLGKVKISKTIEERVKKILSDLVEEKSSAQRYDELKRTIETYRVLTSYSNDGAVHIKISSNTLYIPFRQTI